MIYKELWHKEAEEKMKSTTYPDPLFDVIQRTRDKSNAANSRADELEKAIEEDLDKAEDCPAAPYDRDNIRRDLMKLRRLKDSYSHISLLLGDPDFKQLEERYLG